MALYLELVKGVERLRGGGAVCAENAGAILSTCCVDRHTDGDDDTVGERRGG